MARRSGARRCRGRRDLFSLLMNFGIQTPREPDSRGVFRFWRDPLCLGSWALYILNRFVLAPRFGTDFPFLRDHFNDLLLVPAALAPFLWARQKLGLRRAMNAPTWREIVVLTLLASIVFEGLGPKFVGHSVGDWRDVFVYWLGALVAGAWWNRSKPVE